MGLLKNAKGAFLSFAAYFQIQVKEARDKGDIAGGSEKGAAPWKLGMLSACLYLWDITWATVNPSADAEILYIGKEHVMRAFKLLLILDKIASGFRETPEDQEKAVSSGGEECDVDFSPKIMPHGVRDTDVARRLIMKCMVETCSQMLQVAEEGAIDRQRSQTDPPYM